MTRGKIIIANRREFIKRLEKAGIEYHMSIMRQLAGSADKAMKMTAKQIIPNNVSTTKGFIAEKIYKYPTGWQAKVKHRVDYEVTLSKGANAGARVWRSKYPWDANYKVQKSTSGKVTSRTGQLYNVLAEKGTWDFTKSRGKFNGNPHVKNQIRPQFSNDGKVTYLMDIGLSPSGPVVNMNQRLKLDTTRPFFTTGINLTSYAVEPDMMSNVIGKINVTI
jgi:hypothetical protein